MKMVDGSSSSTGKNTAFPYSARIDKKTPVNAILDTIGKLTG